MHSNFCATSCVACPAMECESRDLKGGSMRKVILSIVTLTAMVLWDCATEHAGADGVQVVHHARKAHHAYRTDCLRGSGRLPLSLFLLFALRPVRTLRWPGLLEPLYLWWLVPIDRSEDD